MILSDCDAKLNVSHKFCFSFVHTVELLKTVYDSGCRHFDTAEVYGNPDPNKHNEVVLGKFLNTVPRASFSVATKYYPRGDNHSYEIIKDHLKQSLQRLGLEQVDLYYAHRVPSIEFGKSFAETAKRLQEEGLIKEVGLSEVSGKWLKEIYPICPISAVQQEWSLLTRNLEEELVPVCKELDVAVVAYSPLSRNLLVQKVETAPNDWRGNQPRYSAENLAKNNAAYDQVHAIASKLDCTAAQLCLAWLLAQAEKLRVSVVPIAGTTKKDRAVENFGAINVDLAGKLEEADWKILDGLADGVVGDRYASIGMTIEAQVGK
mmetsp:Transcript_25533/g.59924  ORF Transcript_25533/g.59924 Transcript_25533/m.59924 type:complete len:319 (-) Transcript_25533:839-1795(-)